MANGPCQTLDRGHEISYDNNDCSAIEDGKQQHDLEIGPSNKTVQNNPRAAPSLPDELIQAILFAITCSFPVRLATITLANCSLISRRWYRLASPMLYTSPMINMGSRLRALTFLDRLVDELLEYELELMDSVKRKRRSSSLIDQMRRLMFFGEGRWRHRASFDSRPDVVDRSTLHEILNRLWCTRIEALVFVELPFTNPLHRPLVNRYPASLSTLILLTPLSHFELLFILRDLPSLRHLCIGSHDDTSTVPAEHHTLFSREQLPSSNLLSFGISARTLEAWLRTGMPWYQSILNLLVVPSVRSITTLHLELADEDDERHLLAILGRPPSTISSSRVEPLSSASSGDRPVPEQLFKLETVFLRGLSSVLMAESLSRLQGIRKLCLSSIYGTALRCPSPLSAEHTDRSSPPLGPLHSLGGVESQMEGLTIPEGRPSRRSLSSKNLVWQAIPSSLEELSIDITRLTDHGPWNRRSADQLTRTLASLISSQQCPHLRSLGSILADPAFEFGIFGPHRSSPPLSDLLSAAKNHHVLLVQSFWCDSFVVNPSGTDWYQ
ncbi:uncharacterized protein PGTG_15626 [Puccinia graminis f. sp. tritici CRL 75-36-700-3]|uniref:F-box domain-containing protein n=1 Tax=Puccinia graminis f. sp. tritici (strain CRL 75-36-700-3 / race SCCL) TaxID=418459 RepID=E3KZD8_PUCGT|nr:uncharacterized protein PGTG_15626 [Puccinia graminis f. sp. tritici CRL 75-36-700-3]EFP89663.1 hypothetical protein PGTG_15626 [Puccinia graminis f. sp. tritici CRL 75-36-700-3]